MEDSGHSRPSVPCFDASEKMLEDTQIYLFDIGTSLKVDADNAPSLKPSEKSFAMRKLPSSAKGKNLKSGWNVDLGGFSTAHALSSLSNSLKKDTTRTKKQTEGHQPRNSLGALRRESLKSSKNKKRSDSILKPDTLKKMKDAVELFDDFESLLGTTTSDVDNLDDDSEKSTSSQRIGKISAALEMALTISKRNSVIKSIKDFSEKCNDSEIMIASTNGEANKDLPTQINSYLDEYSTDALFPPQEPDNISIASKTSKHSIQGKKSNEEKNCNLSLQRRFSQLSACDNISAKKKPLFFFETKRAAAVDQKITLSIIFLRTYAVVLNEGVEELARVEVLVDGAARANQAFSQSLKSTLEKSLGKDSHSHDVGQASSHSYASTVSTYSCKSFQDPLDSLFTSQSLIAAQFSGNANHALSSTIQEITHLQEETEARSKYIEQMGDALLNEFEAVEKYVQKCWQLYNEAAVSASSDNSQRSKSLLNSKKSDLWLLEMRYRVAVKYQASLWNSISVRLSEMLLSGREKELERRVRLQALLLDFVSKQKRLIGSCSSMHPEILQELLDRSEEEEIEIDLKNTLQSHLEPFERWEKKSLLDMSQSLAESEEQVLCDLDILECPLASELVTACKIVERKTQNSLVNYSWQKMMAVTTAHCSFHVFEVPDVVGRNVDVVDAFLSLLPDPWIPHSIDQKLENINTIDERLDISPSETFFLPKCDISKERSGQIKITEQRVVHSSTRNFFPKKDAREIVLRSLTSDRDKGNEWCEDFGF